MATTPTTPSSSSSRLIVKNLPDGVTEGKLKELFESRGGVVTDVQLKRSEDGKFRHFGFVGFQKEEEASRAKDYFNKSFIGAAKMDVDICYNLHDPNKPRPWSKHGKQKLRDQEKDHSLQSKKKKRKECNEMEEGVGEGEGKGAKMDKRKRKEEELLEKAQQDPDFLEFLQVHDKSQAKWGNDTVLDTLEKLVSKKRKEGKGKGKEEEALPQPVQGEEEGDEGEEIKTKGKGAKKKKSPTPPPQDTFFTLKLRNLPKKTKKKDIKTFFAPLVPKSIRTPPNLRGFAYVGFLTEGDQKKGLSKNRSILLGNQVVVKKYSSRSAILQGAEAKSQKWDSQRQELAQVAEAVEESGRIFVRNLSYTVTEEDLRDTFQKFGPVTEVHLPVDRLTRRSKGFAFVSFLLPEQAAKAFESLDGSTFQGRMLHLLPSKNKGVDGEGEEGTGGAGDAGGGGSSYKRKKEGKLKASSSSSHNWNSLFLGQNAVSVIAAERYGVSREQLLLDSRGGGGGGDEEGGRDRNSSVAVRMALAETEIVSETKRFLEANGVCLDSFEEGSNIRKERSTTTFLVKNLVADTTEDELRTLFEKFGVVGRVLLPPAGITAIVEFMVGAEARAAFKKLAYSRFKGMPLFLEWAPLHVFRIASSGSMIRLLPRQEEEGKTTPTPPPRTAESKEEEEIQLPNYEGDKEGEDPWDEENLVPEPETTLFVKNLNFSSGETDLKKHFSGVGRVFAVTVARKKDPKKDGEMLSQGFGFVQFYRAKDAAKALSSLNQSLLQNHSLELKMSSRTLQSESGVVRKDDEGKKKGNKILVRNVPFQASEEEITDLFKVFGKLRGVRMPKKAMGESQHRGFAFIDYFVEANAKSAFETLSKSTHMYGRRLVLEWAAKDASVEELRAKVATQYSSLRSSSSSAPLASSSTKKQLRRYFETAAGTGTSSKGGPDQEEDQDEDE